MIGLCDDLDAHAKRATLNPSSLYSSTSAALLVDKQQRSLFNCVDFFGRPFPKKRNDEEAARIKNADQHGKVEEPKLE
jgi:hypothetical protein